MTFAVEERKKMSDKNLTEVSIPIKLKRRGIVYCEDCKYWAELTFLVPPKHHCGRLLQQYKGISERVSFETDADDFCSKGERAE